MSFNMLYGMLRNQHQRSLYNIHTGTDTGKKKTVKKGTVKVVGPPKDKMGKLFISEFRFIIMTILIVVSSLTMQETIQDALEVYVRSKFKSPGRRIAMMFLFSLCLVTATIFVIIFWKPHRKQQVSVETVTSKQQV
jgi:hypothetical protein